jgi:ABC-type transport system involved in multi-copper enzyme maturation permease subunit
MVVSRLLFGLGLALFPPVMVALIQYQGGDFKRDVAGPIVLFLLVPGLTCAMALLLWAIPAIPSEVEGRTWPYLAVRPGGKQAVLLGKYLTAVVWTVAVAWISLTLCLLVIRPEEHPLGTWYVLAALAGLSALSYGSLYVLFGVVFLRRAMVIAVAYTFLMEVVTSFIPAVIHQLTVQYHLRSLLAKWMWWAELPTRIPTDQQWLFSKAPAWQHALILLGLTAVMLTAATVVLRQRQLVKPDED